MTKMTREERERYDLKAREEEIDDALFYLEQWVDLAEHVTNDTLLRLARDARDRANGELNRVLDQMEALLEGGEKG